MISGWGRDEERTFAELTVHAECSGSEAIGIIAASKDADEFGDRHLYRKAADNMRARIEVMDLMVRMKAGEVGIRKKTETLFLRYVIPKCRVKMGTALNKNFDTEAKGAAFHRLVKMFEKVVAAIPDDPENAEKTALGNFATFLKKQEEDRARILNEKQKKKATGAAEDSFH